MNGDFSNSLSIRSQPSGASEPVASKEIPYFSAGKKPSFLALEKTPKGPARPISMIKSDTLIPQPQIYLTKKNITILASIQFGCIVFFTVSRWALNSPRRRQRCMEYLQIYMGYIRINVSQSGFSSPGMHYDQHDQAISGNGNKKPTKFFWFFPTINDHQNDPQCCQIQVLNLIPHPLLVCDMQLKS